MGNWEALQPWDDAVEAALKAGEFLRALDVLTQAYQHAIVGFCSNMLGDTGLSEDVAQNVFIAAYEAMPRFRLHSSVRTWLFAIARHVCLQEAKKTRRRREIVASNTDLIAELTHTSLPQSAEHLYCDWHDTQFREFAIDRLPYFLKQLKAEERDVLMLHYYAGFTYTEIAQNLRRPKSAIRRRLDKALRHLEELMRQEARSKNA